MVSRFDAMTSTDLENFIDSLLRRDKLLIKSENSQHNLFMNSIRQFTLKYSSKQNCLVRNKFFEGLQAKKKTS